MDNLAVAHRADILAHENRPGQPARVLHRSTVRGVLLGELRSCGEIYPGPKTNSNFAPENGPKRPKRKPDRLHSVQFSGAKMSVSGRVTWFTWTHGNLRVYTPQCSPIVNYHDPWIIWPYFFGGDWHWRWARAPLDFHGFSNQPLEFWRFLRLNRWIICQNFGCVEPSGLRNTKHLTSAGEMNGSPGMSRIFRC